MIVNENEWQIIQNGEKKVKIFRGGEPYKEVAVSKDKLSPVELTKILHAYQMEVIK